MPKFSTFHVSAPWWTSADSSGPYSTLMGLVMPLRRPWRILVDGRGWFWTLEGDDRPWWTLDDLDEPKLRQSGPLILIKITFLIINVA